MALIRCTECNHEISSEAKMCPHCGKSNNTCKECHRSISPSINTCPYCGYQNESDDNFQQVNANVTLKNDTSNKGNCIMAFVGFFVSIIGLLFFNLFGIIPFLGIILSYLGLRKLDDENTVSIVFAILGIIIGIIGFVIGLISLITLIGAFNFINNYVN